MSEQNTGDFLFKERQMMVQDLLNRNIKNVSVDQKSCIKRKRAHSKGVDKNLVK